MDVVFSTPLFHCTVHLSLVLSQCLCFLTLGLFTFSSRYTSVHHLSAVNPRSSCKQLTGRYSPSETKTFSGWDRSRQIGSFGSWVPDFYITNPHKHTYSDKHYLFVWFFSLTSILSKEWKHVLSLCMVVGCVIVQNSLRSLFALLWYCLRIKPAKECHSKGIVGIPLHTSAHFSLNTLHCFHSL